jgi:hypothetical protein
MMGFFDDPEPCPHLKPPQVCAVCLQLRDVLDRLERVANIIRCVAGVRDPETRLDLLRRAYALAAGLREVKPPT